MEEGARREGVDARHAAPAGRDPVAAARTGPNARRIIRALEVIRATGQPLSAQRGRADRAYRDLRIGLSLPRAVLYRRIDARVDAMIEAGLVNEVQSLRHAGYW